LSRESYLNGGACAITRILLILALRASLRLFKIVPDDFVKRGSLSRHNQQSKQKNRREAGYFYLNGGACAIRTRDHLLS